MFNLIHILLPQQLPILQKPLILEIMRLHPRMRKQPLGFLELLQRRCIGVQRGNGYLPRIPRPRSRQTDILVVRHQPLVERSREIRALILGQKVQELLVLVGKEVRYAPGLHAPLQLILSYGENAS